LRGKREEKIERLGLVVFLDPRESVADKLEEFQPQSTNIIKERLKPGDIFVDVGASIGWFSLVAAQAVGNGGRVYAFEPEPHSFALLKKNIAANGFEDIIHSQQAAVADTASVLTLYTVGDAYTWSSLEDPRKDYERNVEANFRKDEDRTVYEYTVPGICLDDVLPSNIDFVKINVATGGRVVEQVLEGMAGIFERTPPSYLLICLPTQQVIQSLKSNGYVYRPVDHNLVFFERQ
jgi:FkbM family methyltransferase